MSYVVPLGATPRGMVGLSMLNLKGAPASTIQPGSATVTGVPSTPTATGGLPIVKILLLAGIAVGGYLLVKKLRASKAAPLTKRSS